MALKRMDDVGIVVEDLDGVIDFFRGHGLELEGRAAVGGEWAGRVSGLRDQHVETAHDAHTGRAQAPGAFPLHQAGLVADHRNAPVNALGYLRAMFTVDDIDDMLEWLGACGGEVVRDKDVYRRCYIRGSEGLLVGLAQEVC